MKVKEHMKQILIVEDDREIAELERDYLEASSLQVTIAGDGETGRREALSGKYDLVILDLMLPGCDGFRICRAIRKKFLIPVLVVSARQTDIDKIRAFGLGADDYLTKPFSPGEMVARVKARLMRFDQLQHAMGKQYPAQSLQCGSLRAEPLTHRVFLDDREIFLAGGWIICVDSPCFEPFASACGLEMALLSAWMWFSFSASWKIF